MHWNSAWAKPCAAISTPSAAATRKRRPHDPRHRHRPLRSGAHREGARALRRPLCGEGSRGFGAGGFPAAAQARRLPRQALRGEGGVLQGAGHRNPLSRQLAQRLGRQRPVGKARARVLESPVGLPEEARNREGPRVPHRRDRDGVRLRGRRGAREAMRPGTVMLDLSGAQLTAEEKERLRHPSAGGVILFARNFESPRQLLGLTREIRAQRPELLVAVDHEGGRVQRFQEGFTRIPPMRLLGDRWEADTGEARALAEAIGYVIAVELRAHGVDFSFAPVLDVDFGASGVIGDRAFSDESTAIAALAGAFVSGLAAGGAASVGKHFPGHGYVKADSHVAVPVDSRSYADIEANDLHPYRELIAHGLTGVMPAHVIYPQIDPQPAGYSRVWLKDILRGRLGFQGMIFSDDLSMEGASVAGGPVARALAALEAGCDMVLLCNAPDAAGDLLEALKGRSPDASRMSRMR